MKIFLSYGHDTNAPQIEKNLQLSVLKSESGAFFTDGNGVAQRFEPADDNSFVEEEITIKGNYTYDTCKSIRTFNSRLHPSSVSTR